jgi:lysozyme
MIETLRAKIHRILLAHEGSRSYPYTDTVGKITIGIGRNLTDRGISQSEIDFLLENDIDYFLSYLVKTYTWFSKLPEGKQAALVDMCFNLGTKGFSEFKLMLNSLSASDFKSAAQQMLDSKWASQVGQRANDLASMIRSG